MFPPKYLTEQNAQLIESDQRKDHEDLRDDIGWSDDEGEDEDEKNGISSPLGQHLSIDHSDSCQNQQEHGKFENQAENQQNSNAERKVSIHIRHGPDKWSSILKKELAPERKGNKVPEENTQGKKERASKDKRRNISFLVLIQAAAHKSPDLIKDEGRCQHHTCDEANLHISKESFSHTTKNECTFGWHYFDDGGS